MSSPQKVLNCRYRYDPLDRLASHNLSDTPERHRFYCKSRLASEVQGAIEHSIVQQGDLLLAQHLRQNGVLDSTLLATDLQRSVLHTCKSDRQSQPIVYSPYGHHPAESGLSSLLGFNGERPDPVTGHYLLGNGYRAFNPALMRFNSSDSLSPFGKGGLNSYSYCLGDPVNLSDPNGHIPIAAIVAKTINKIGKTVKPTNSGVKKLITPASGMGQFERFKGSPHIIESIVRHLPGSDMAALAQTSSKMKNTVYSAAKELPNELRQIKMVSKEKGQHGYYIIGGTSAGHLDYIYSGNIQKIGSGMVPGILPVQLPQAGIEVSFSGTIIDDIRGIGSGSGRFTDAQQGKIFTLRART